jgi:murein DD-endopeptidase MepM/ murein hydrolase activator NlpD
MYKNRYYYNPETLKFEKFERTFYLRLKRVLAYMLIVSLIAVVLRISFEQFAPSPKVKYYQLENKNIKFTYDKLRDKIKKSELLLIEIQKRDDKLYRSVFDLEPLPGSVREAGFGGSFGFTGGILNSDGLEMINSTDTRLEILSNKVLIQSWSLTDLYSRAKYHQKLILAKPFIHPISPADSFWMTSGFGYRKDPFNGSKRMHSGIDLAGPVGLKIYATGDGVVTDAENSKRGYGKEVVIDHGFGYITRYAHLHKITVKAGQKIKRGQNIGNLGSTGRSTGPHLHYEVIYQGRYLNPVYFYYENVSPEEYDRITNLAYN